MFLTHDWIIISEFPTLIDVSDVQLSSCDFGPNRMTSVLLSFNFKKFDIIHFLTSVQHDCSAVTASVHSKSHPALLPLKCHHQIIATQQPVFLVNATPDLTQLCINAVALICIWNVELCQTFGNAKIAIK